VEEVLAGIWASVLGVSRVGRHDNFFELGGDSILTIQVAARARRAGLGVTPREVFERPTLARLAEVACSIRPVTASAAPVSGPAPLTPIQRWHLERELQAPHHYNQALLLEVPAGMDASALEGALRGLLAHHDQLRAYYERVDGAWRQAIARELGPEVAVLRRRDLAALSDAARAERIARDAGEIQAQLDLSSPPLLRAAYFDCGLHRPGRLLLVVHHLLVDAVSWQILLEDLENAYGRLAGGEPPVWPPKTTSFQEWAHRLEAQANGPLLRSELGSWRRAIEQARPYRPLPRDYEDAQNSVASARSVSVRLDRSATRALLQSLPHVYHADMQDALLVAMGRSLARWTGQPLVLIDVEGHGREALADEDDLSRTVGWFTTVTPLAFAAAPDASLHDALIHVKEQRRAQPRGGIGYGLLRYMAHDPSVRASMAAGWAPEVSLNYLGQIHRLMESAGRFRLASEPLGPDQDPEAARPHLLAVSAHVEADELVVAWSYSEARHARATVDRLAQTCEEELQRLANLCESAQEVVHTPSDFPLVDLGERTLERILEGQGAVEDILPVAPLHEGILYESLSRQGSAVYVEQFTFTMTDPRADATLYEEAWQRVVDRHAMLRVAFVWENTPSTYLVVKPRVLVPVDHQDWRQLPAEEREERWRAYLEADEERGFRLSAAPLMRLALIRTGEHEHRVVWSFHHLLLDGWSASLVLQEVFALVRAEQGSTSAPLPPAPSYRRYAAWLRRQDAEGSLEFWRAALAGFRAPTSVPLASRAHGAGRFEVVDRQLSAELTEDLRRFAARNGLTLNALIQGAYALLLSRHAGEKDVVYGVTVSGRPAEVPDVERLVGLFINTLPMRVRVPEEGAPLVPWLRALHEQQSALLEHAHVDMARIQAASEMPRGVRLFDSVFVFANYPVDKGVIADAEFLGVGEAALHGFTEYAITLTVAAARHVTLALKYDCGRLGPAEASSLLQQMCTALASIVAAPEGRIDDVTLLDRHESRRILTEWSRGEESAEPPDILVHDLVAGQARHTPEAPAVVDGPGTLGFRDLDERANQLAHHLIRAGIGPEEVVGLHLSRTAEAIVGLLGVLKAGAAYMPLDPEYPVARLQYMLRNSGARVLLSRSDLDAAALVAGSPCRLVQLDRDWPAIGAEPRRAPARRAWPSNLVYLLYTSGSTGEPKGVMVQHDQLLSYLSWARRVFPFEAGCGVPVHSPLGFDITTSMILLPLMSGRPVVLVGRS
jgi:non-ribosomal peptide synthase protein (TIGR01720 family)